MGLISPSAQRLIGAPELCVVSPIFRHFRLVFFFELAVAFQISVLVAHTTLHQPVTPTSHPATLPAYSFYMDIDSAPLLPPLPAQRWSNNDSPLHHSKFYIRTARRNSLCKITSVAPVTSPSSDVPASRLLLFIYTKMKVALL